MEVVSGIILAAFGLFLAYKLGYVKFVKPVKSEPTAPSVPSEPAPYDIEDEVESRQRR